MDGDEVLVYYGSNDLVLLLLLPAQNPAPLKELLPELLKDRSKVRRLQSRGDQPGGGAVLEHLRQNRNTDQDYVVIVTDLKSVPYFHIGGKKKTF